MSALTSIVPNNATAPHKMGLPELATEINTEHALVNAALRSGFDHALRAGQLLLAARQKMPHGKWTPWLSENFTASERTAQAYMRIAREYPNLELSDPAKAQRVADLSLRDALAELSSGIGGAARLRPALIEKAVIPNTPEVERKELKRAERAAKKEQTESMAVGMLDDAANELRANDLVEQLIAALHQCRKEKQADAIRSLMNRLGIAVRDLGERWSIIGRTP